MKFTAGVAAVIVGLILIITYSAKAQIFILYHMYSLGAGWDDGATSLFIENKANYKPVVLNMLDAPHADAFDAQASFLFAEMLLDDDDIKLKVEQIAKKHPDTIIRCFWFDVLNGRFEARPLATDTDDTSVWVIRDSGSQCQ